jgi:hypothetical protein
MSQTAAVTTVCRSNYDVVRRDGFDIQSKKWGQGIFRPHKGRLPVGLSLTISYQLLICEKISTQSSEIQRKLRETNSIMLS